MQSQSCPQCGFQLSPFDTECPRCARVGVAVEAREPRAGCEICERMGKLVVCVGCRKQVCQQCVWSSSGLDILCRNCAPPDVRQEPIEERPVKPALGQDLEPGSKAYIKELFRSDRLFGAMLVFLAIGFVLYVLQGNFLGMILSGAIVWGVLTLRWWAYIFTMVAAGFGMFSTLLGLGILAFAKAATGVSANIATVVLMLLLQFGIFLFILIVLYTRRAYFT